MQKMEGKRRQEQGYFKDKAIISYLAEEGMEKDLEEEEEIGGAEEKKKKKVMEKVKGPGSGSGSDRALSRSCQVEKCTADLMEAKQYHRRHKVCEVHAKAPAAIVAGVRQRFCQQCSRFHELLEFDEAKRSCRRRLAGHNERRRKSSSDSFGEGSGRRGVNSQLIQTEERNRVEMTLTMSNPSLKQSQIR